MLVEELHFRARSSQGARTLRISPTFSDTLAKLLFACAKTSSRVIFSYF